jgi:hypothetical protein
MTACTKDDSCWFIDCNPVGERKQPETLAYYKHFTGPVIPNIAQFDLKSIILSPVRGELGETRAPRLNRLISLSRELRMAPNCQL